MDDERNWNLFIRCFLVSCCSFLGLLVMCTTRVLPRAQYEEKKPKEVAKEVAKAVAKVVARCGVLGVQGWVLLDWSCFTQCLLLQKVHPGDSDFDDE